MKRRDLILFLIVEASAVAVAGGAFAVIAPRLWAGLVAGFYFIASSSWMLKRVAAWPARWRALMTYPLLVHVFVISIPMVATRLLNAGADFDEVHVWGLPGPLFHRVSVNVFGVLVAATAVDLIRARRDPPRA